MSQNSTTRTDQIFRETKWLAALVIPFLITAFVLLFFWPNQTEQTFAWTILPSMTPMMLGSTYIGGVYFFTRVLFSTRWHHIKVGFLPTMAFTLILGIATLLHWDRFNHSHISFFTWTALYMTTPFLVGFTWLRNRVTDTGISDGDDATIPVGARMVMGVAGIITILISALLLFQPALMISVWPWKLTPLTARVISAMFVLPGLVGVGVAADPRWSSARLILQTQAFSIFFILISALRAWGDFDPANPISYAFIGGLASLLVSIGVVSYLMEAQGRKKKGVPVEPAPLTF
jgi:hypothetical protein